MKSNSKYKSRKGKKNERPLSLFPMSFNQALDKLLAAKPKRDGEQKKA
jgi:hypothetical protein